MAWLLRDRAGGVAPGAGRVAGLPDLPGHDPPVEDGTDYHNIKYIWLNSTLSQRYLHDKLAVLEGGEAALATASGMAALTTTLLSLLRGRPCAGRRLPVRRDP